MGANKHYQDYRSYRYLEKDRAYKSFTLAKEIGRVPSRQLALSPTEEQRVQTLLAQHIAIFMHDHPVALTPCLAIT
jgi:membrane dipeptidase